MRNREPINVEELAALMGSLEILDKCNIHLRYFDGLIAKVEQLEGYIDHLMKHPETIRKVG